MGAIEFFYYLNIFLSFFVVIFFVLLILFFEYNKKCEMFVFERDPDRKRSDVKRTTFPTFEFHAEKDGYLQLGDLLLNWGESDKQGLFAKSFVSPHACLVTPHRNGSGIFNVKVRKISNEKVNIHANSCERPNRFFCVGWADIQKPKSQITVNNVSRKPVLFQSLCMEKKMRENNVSGGSGCSKTSTVRPWQKDA